MSYPIEFSKEDASLLYDWVVSLYSPRKILISGTQILALIQCFVTSGIETVILEPDDAAGLNLHNASSDEEFDVVLLSQDVVDGFVKNNLINNVVTSGIPKDILVLFWKDSDEVLLPGAARALWKMGYARNFTLQKWAGRQSVLLSFHKDDDDSSSIIEAYEAEVWRLSQLNQKKSGLLVDYRSDIDQEIRRSQQVDLQVDILNKRWDAFWDSRTGKALKLFRKGRQFLLPIGSRRQWFLGLFLRAFRAMKREGPVGFARALPAWLNKRIKRRLAIYRLQHASIGGQQVVEIDPVLQRTDYQPHTQDVDIIVCVHNALADVSRCLDSVNAHTTHPYNLIIVDDGSDVETAHFLAEYAQKNSVTLLRSEQATGYTRAANRGLRASRGTFVVLLNSDTIVTQGWLDRMVSCAQTDPKIGIVGPLSNTASWQSIPRIEEDGDWAENALPEGISVERMGKLVAEQSSRLYPDLPFLNGFCLMVNRRLIEEIGLFDEDGFGEGYGEEDDYALRARKAGWKLALADDAYIYHAQSKSYSNERRRMLSARAGKLLAAKHGQEIIQEGVEFCHHNRVLDGIRARALAAIERDGCIRQGSKFSGMRILYILPITSPGGGANVIRAESLVMKKMGVEVEYFNLQSNKEQFLNAYPNLEFPMIFGEIDDIPDIASNYDAVIATYNPSVAWMRGILQLNGRPVRGYYVQGYEPLMYPPYSSDYDRAVKSYSLFPNLVRFTKTDWTQKMVYENTGERCSLVGVSFNLDLYRPRPRSEPEWPYRPIRISAMIRPEAPYREPQKTMQLLKDISKTYGNRVEVYIFGTKADNPDFLSLPIDFNWKLFGVLTQERVANLLNQVDIFVDYSSHQAMGLTALEAMSSGCAVVVPSNGGATSFARHEYNSMIVDTSEYENVLKGVKRLVENDQLRQTIQRNAIYDVCAYFPERVALNILNTLFEDRRI